MKTSIVVVGSLVMDLIAYAPRRPELGETLIGTDFVEAVGGKGFNQAVAAARAGVEVTLVSCVGNDRYGDALLTAVREEGIDDKHVRTSDAGTAVGLPVVVADGQNSIVLVPRAAATMTSDDVLEAQSAIADAVFVLLQLELGVEVAVAAAAAARKAGAKVVLNAAPALDCTALAGAVDLLVVNEQEAAMLTQRTDASPMLAGQQLHAAWHCPVVVTVGADGVVLVEDGSVTAIPAIEVVPVDSVGAGDVFCGNLAAQLATGADLETAARWASVAAGLSLQRPGAALSAPHRTETSAYLTSPQRRRQHDLERA